MENQTACWRRRVDVLGQRPESAATLLNGLHDVEKVTKGSRQAVVLGDNDHIALPELIEELVELGAFSNRAADLVGEDAFGSGCRESVGLGIQELVVCGNAGIAKDHASMVPKTSQKVKGSGGRVLTRVNRWFYVRQDRKTETTILVLNIHQNRRQNGVNFMGLDQPHDLTTLCPICLLPEEPPYSP